MLIGGAAIRGGARFDFAAPMFTTLKASPPFTSITVSAVVWVSPGEE